MSNGQFEHRAQTNDAIVIGVCTHAAKLKMLVNKETGEAVQHAELTMRVDNGDESTFITVEGYDALAILALQMQRRGTYQLTGRMIVTDRKKQSFNAETQQWEDVLGADGKPIYFQNYKLRLMDRRTKFDGTPNPEAPAPITSVKPETRHQCAVLFYGTIGKNGVSVSPTSNGRIRARFTAANNGGSAAKPHTSWMPVAAYANVAREVIGCGSGSLVKVYASLNVYKNGAGQTRCEFIAKNIVVISKKEAGAPASSATVEQNANADALDVLAALNGDGGQPFDGPIDPEDTSLGEHEGEELANVTQLADAAPAGGRRRKAQAAA